MAPYSYFNLMGSDPPYVAFGSTGVKDSLKNLREVPEFVANIVTMHLLEKMNFTSGDFPRDEDEFDWAALTPAPAAKVRPFRVAEAKAHLECEVAQIVTDRNTNIVLGRIVHAHVDPSVWKTGASIPSCSIRFAASPAPVTHHSVNWSTSAARSGRILRAPPGSMRCPVRSGDKSRRPTSRSPQSETALHRSSAPAILEPIESQENSANVRCLPSDASRGFCPRHRQPFRRLAL